MTKQTQTNMLTIRQFACRVGAHKATIHGATGVYREAFAGADEDGQKHLRREWMIGHVHGALAVDEATAESIVASGKGAKSTNTAEQKLAIDSAYSDFRHHVMQASTSAKAQAQADAYEVPADILAAARALVSATNTYEGSKSELKALAARALAQAWAE